MNQPLGQRVGVRQWVVPEELDDRGHVPDLRIGGIPFPGEDAGFIHANPLRDCFLGLPDWLIPLYDMGTVEVSR